MYNKYQLEAINSTEEKVIIVAPPGSGKTHTMTGAIQKFLKENPINIGITAITFTNKAADELRERLGFNAGSVHIATIHSWSYTELQKLSKAPTKYVRAAMIGSPSWKPATIPNTSSSDKPFRALV